MISPTRKQQRLAAGSSGACCPALHRSGPDPRCSRYRQSIFLKMGWPTAVTRCKACNHVSPRCTFVSEFGIWDGSAIHNNRPPDRALSVGRFRLLPCRKEKAVKAPGSYPKALPTHRSLPRVLQKSRPRSSLTSDKFAYPRPLRPEPKLQDRGVVVAGRNG